MTPPLTLPDDPLERFRDIYLALTEDRSWFQGVMPFRYSALTLITAGGKPKEINHRLRQIADRLKERAGWFGPLNSPIRFIIAAMLLREGDRPDPFLDAVESASGRLRDLELKNGGIYEVIAILILRAQNGGGPIQSAQLQRMKQIYDMMKSKHWWLTGRDDYPACALLAGRDEGVETMGQRIERLYSELDAAGFSKGNPLQLTSHILYLHPGETHRVVEQFQDIFDEFRSRGLRMHSGDYDEIAMLSFLEHTPKEIADRTIAHRKSIELLKPRPDKELSFDLAVGTSFLDLVRLDADLQQVQGAQLLTAVQTVIAAQQAAAAAAATAAAGAAAANG